MSKHCVCRHSTARRSLAVSLYSNFRAVVGAVAIANAAVCAVVLMCCAACYDSAPQTGGKLNFTCEDPIPVLGVSYNDRADDGFTGTNLTDPYDQGIMFMTDARPGPYYK